MVQNFMFIFLSISLKKPKTGLEPVNLFLTKEVLYLLSYLGGKAGDETRTHNNHLGRVELYQLSYARKKFISGQGWFRTTVGIRQWIYSPSPLTTRAPTQKI